MRNDIPLTLTIPQQLMETCSSSDETRAWLGQLPEAVRTVQKRWMLAVSEPFQHNEGSCAWVAPVTRSNGMRAVLKLGMPHMEATHEIHGLRFWAGNPSVRLLEADEGLNAMLLERCEPGTVLRELPEPQQDVIIAGLLRRLWREPPAPHPFRPLSTMTACWADETLAQRAGWVDTNLVQKGLRLFEELPRTAPTNVLLATDLHAGNVLCAQREPWLVIDPKPFVGDPAYDATQHLLNCRARMQADPYGTIHRFADLLEVDEERVRLWMFARYAAESYAVSDDDTVALARRLSD